MDVACVTSLTRKAIDNGRYYRRGRTEDVWLLMPQTLHKKVRVPVVGDDQEVTCGMSGCR